MTHKTRYLRLISAAALQENHAFRLALSLLLGVAQGYVVYGRWPIWRTCAWHEHAGRCRRKKAVMTRAALWATGKRSFSPESQTYARHKAHTPPRPPAPPGFVGNDKAVKAGKNRYVSLAKSQIIQQCEGSLRAPNTTTTPVRFQQRPSESLALPRCGSPPSAGRCPC